MNLTRNKYILTVLTPAVSYIAFSSRIKHSFSIISPKFYSSSSSLLKESESELKERASTLKAQIKTARLRNLRYKSLNDQILVSDDFDAIANRKMEEAEIAHEHAKSVVKAARQSRIDEINGDFEGEAALFDPKSFPFSVDTETLVADAETFYQERINATHKSRTPAKDLSHFNNSESAAEMALSTDMYTRWKSSKELYSKWLDNIVKAASRGVPVNSSYIRALERSLNKRHGAECNPVSFVNPHGENTSAKAAYGMAHGAYDLIHFMESKFSKVEFKVRTLSPTKSNKRSLSIDLIGYNDGAIVETLKVTSLDYPFSFDNYSELNEFKHNNSIFNNENHLAVMKEMYAIGQTDDISVEFCNIDSVELESIQLRTDDKNGRYEDGYKHTTYITEGLTTPNHSCSLSSQLFTLFLISNKHMGISGEDKKEFLMYLGTCVHHYVRQHIKVAAETKLIGFNFNVTIERNVRNPNLVDKFRELVETGNCVPLTPLQYQHYLGLNRNLNRWMEYSFVSALLNPLLCVKFKCMLPSISTISRARFVRYAKNKRRLTSAHYMPDVSVPHQIDQKFEISWPQFVQEMFVRTVMEEPMPDYLYPITSGEWQIAGTPLDAVTPADFNRTFCKFEMLHNSREISDFVDSMLMLDNDLDYVRQSVRLSEKLPLIYSIYVQSSSFIPFDVEDDSYLVGSKDV